MNYIGIDIGTTNIKIIETDEKLKIINKEIFETQNPNNALRKFIEKNNINLKSIKQIVATGIGANKLNKEYEKISISFVQEFIAISNGGEFVLNKDNYVVASIGTGTAFVKNINGKITHAGGTGVGGGTLINLCKRIKPQITFEEIKNVTQKYKLENVDLLIKDVTTQEIKTLPKDITAVNLGKLNENTKNEELILGIVNMVFEIIGVMAAFTSKEDKLKNIVVTGQLASIPYAKTVFNKIELLHNVKFIIPEDPEYMVSLGAIKEELKKL